MPQLPEAPEAPAASRPAIRRLLPLAVLVAAAVLVIALGGHRLLSLETVLARRAELSELIAAHYLAALAGFVLLYVATVALSVPGATVLTVSGGALFGAVAGTLAACVGATLGATLLFLLARYAFADAVARRLGPRLSALAEGFRADAFGYLLFLRLTPIFPFWLVNLAPAVVGVRLPVFVAATALGIVPVTIAFAVFGAGLDSALAAQQEALRACDATGGAGCKRDLDLSRALTPQLVLGLSLVGAAALLPALWRRWRSGRREPGP